MKRFIKVYRYGRDFLTGVTVGRSDLSASMGIDKGNIECDEIFDATKKFLIMSRNVGLSTNFGENIGIGSILFIKKMALILTDMKQGRSL